MVVEAYYAALSAIFFPVLTLPKFLGELVIAAFVIFIITLLYRFLIDQNKMKELKDEQKELQKKSKELQKTNPEESQKVMGEVLKLSNKQMSMSLKPMIPTMIIAFAFLPWMRIVFTSPVVLLPFNLPFFGPDFGWMMWYLIISIPLSQLFRKFMGVT